MNISLASKILKTLAQAGVEDILICAGARNSPLVFILEKIKNVNVVSFFEERSAAFYALGISQKKNKPVAIITTSGTAVAELLPAAVEATYTQTPLIFVTADRPRTYRGTGAPQSIDQVGIFSKYVETCFDIDHNDETFDFAGWSQRAPLQMNVCFQEPLIDAEIPILDFKSEERKYFPVEEFFVGKKAVLDQPLVIAGTLSESEVENVTPLLAKLGAPIYAEATSNLKNKIELQSLILRGGDKSVEAIFKNGFCQSVLRIGGVPTLRFWRDLEDKYKLLSVTSVSASDYTGLSRSARHIVGYKNLISVQSEWSKDSRKEVFALDLEKKSRLQGLIQQFPQSEVSLIYQLVSNLGQQNIYVGNSLPIRELDLVSGLIDFEKAAKKVSANRGANGIDGQVSTFIGGSEKDRQNWCLIGDLTAMYDLSGLWASRFEQDKQLRLVVINNQGGQIFMNMFKKDIFLNSHDMHFSHWAKMWNWSFQEWTKIPDPLSIKEQHTLIELLPDALQSEQFWREYQKI